jgi:O-methyltransferase
VLFDDFGAWEGCRRAVWDFFAARGEHPLLERMGYEQVYFIKGKEHNRKSGATGLSLSALEPQMTC